MDAATVDVAGDDYDVVVIDKFYTIRWRWRWRTSVEPTINQKISKKIVAET